MPDPLPRNEDRQLDVELELHHFEWRRVQMPHEVADQPPVLMHLLGSGAVGNPCGLDDCRIISHDVDKAHKSFIETPEFFAQQGLNLFCHAAKIHLLFSCHHVVCPP